MTTYQVIKPMIGIADDQGQRHMLYQGAVFSGDNLDTDHVQMLLDEEFIEERESSSEDGPPAKSAAKGDWEAYARSQGASDEDLDGATKDELVEKYGA